MKTISFLKIAAILLILSLFASCSTNELENLESQRNISDVQFEEAKTLLEEYSISVRENIKNFDDLNNEISKTTNHHEEDDNVSILPNVILDNELIARQVVYVNNLPGQFNTYSSDHRSFFIEYINALGKSYDNEVLNTIEEYKSKLETQKTSLSEDAYKELDMLLYASELAYNNYLELDSKSLNASSQFSSKGGFWDCFAGKGKTIGRGIAGGAILGAIGGGVTGALGGTVALPGVGTATGAVGGAVFGAASGAVRGGILAVAWAAADCGLQASLYRMSLEEYMEEFGPVNGPKYFEPFAKIYLTPADSPKELLKYGEPSIFPLGF
ncbi:hypothetical protein [uncultured Aquimarina sp.]|uniref:hypothetical protein n=1 Tax=uncultured Aquimarina sp. TaxID=575652 RepID=UPI00260FF714|nr:hypothetical protein [uncultured Aquimarina sp.]